MFNIFKKNKTKENLMKVSVKKEDTITPINHVKCNYIFSNNYVDICTNACAVCWDKPAPVVFNDKLKYLEKRVKIGHTSVLEHGNFILAFSYNKKHIGNEDVEFLTACKYLNVNTYTDKGTTYIITAGPIRGYHHILDSIANRGIIQRNSFVRAMIDTIYNYSYPELFSSYIDDGIMDRSMFIGVSDCPTNNEIPTDSRGPIYDSKDFMVIAADNFKEIKAYLNQYTNINKIENIDLDKIALDCVSITILFYNMSRTCTHQLVRHRNGITQESQRYVDYSKSMFTSPEVYKDKYKNVSYNIVFDGVEHHFMNLKELGDAIQKIYPQLINPINPTSVPLQREDARAFLPSNIQCRKIYMTFTLRNFFKFINLRADAHAQAEIRDYAYKVKDWWQKEGHLWTNTKQYNDIYVKPKYIREENNTYDNVDEKDDGTSVEKIKVSNDTYVNNPLVTKEEPKD